MMKTILSRTLKMARGTATMLGFAVMLAVVLGVGTTALAAASGDPFKLGRTNTIDKISQLVGSANGALFRVENEGSGPAVDLRVEPGEAPMTVDSTTRVNDLNADEIDGESADEIGVNGVEIVRKDTGPADSDSPKSEFARCPDGKVLVGTGYDIIGTRTGVSPNQLTDVVVDELSPSASTESVFVEAVEEEPTNLAWTLRAIAICATAP